MTSPVESSFTLLSRHGLALLSLAATPEQTLRELGDTLGVTERTAHRIVNDLYVSGLLVREPRGSGYSYVVQDSETLLHPLTDHRSVHDLLRLLDVEHDRG